eukprot:3452600-Pyramimonas_sp.AAC.1
MYTPARIPPLGVFPWQIIWLHIWVERMHAMRRALTIWTWPVRRCNCWNTARFVCIRPIPSHPEHGSAETECLAVLRPKPRDRM